MSKNHSHLDLEYAQINDNIRFLADVRFKLLGLLPVVGGVAVYTLVKEMLGTPSVTGLVSALIASIIGWAATLGLTLYDQRNSELYNALIHRAQFLEKQFDLPKTLNGLKQADDGGQFNERPRPYRWLVLPARHDLALALIYGPLLGGWLFPILYPILRLANVADGAAQLASAVAAVIMALVCVGWLLALDQQEFRLYEVAKTRNEPKKDPDEPKKDV